MDVPTSVSGRDKVSDTVSDTVLSPVYRTYYKAAIKVSTPVKRGYSKARHTRLSDNFITVIQLVIQSVTKLRT